MTGRDRFVKWCVGVRMFTTYRLRRLPMAAIPLGLLINVALSASASAHVKWFCAYNVAGQPDGLENVLCPDFEFLTGLSILALMTGSVLEGTTIGFAMLRSLDRVTRLVRDNLEIDHACGRRFLLRRHLGGGRHLAHAGAQDQLDADRDGATRHRRRHAVAPHDAVIGARHLRAVRRSDLAIWDFSPRRLSGVSRRCRLSCPDGPAEGTFRGPSDRCFALGSRHHADVGVDREMGLSGMVVSACSSSIRGCRSALRRSFTCGPPARSNSRSRSR